MMGDNTATVITITKEITSWRSRHYAYQAGWARDQVAYQPIRVSHLPGIELPADGLTKVLQGTALKKTRIQLTLRNGKEDESDLQQYARNWYFRQPPITLVNSKFYPKHKPQSNKRQRGCTVCS